VGPVLRRGDRARRSAAQKFSDENRLDSAKAPEQKQNKEKHERTRRGPPRTANPRPAQTTSLNDGASQSRNPDGARHQHDQDPIGQGTVWNRPDAMTLFVSHVNSRYKNQTVFDGLMGITANFFTCEL
jgi:hypothetical protein